MIDWYAPIETTDGHAVRPHPRYWPNPVSGEYCGHYGDTETREGWWDHEGKPLDGSPEIRNSSDARLEDLSEKLDLVNGELTTLYTQVYNLRQALGLAYEKAASVVEGIDADCSTEAFRVKASKAVREIEIEH